METIPSKHARFIDMLTYKAELVDIQVEVREESYTSKASFVDLDYRELGSVYRNGTRLCIWPGHLRDEAEPDRLCGKCRKRKGGRADEGSKAN